MAGNPLDIIKQLDQDLFTQAEAARQLALTDGALSRKHKLLIAVALDAAHGAVNGVKSLAMQAQKEGASQAEIMEAIRVAHYISGVGATYTAANALQDVFQE